jgi:hypothetical protein
MQSEQQPIDDFFRRKEETYIPDNSRQNAHWQQLQEHLVKPAFVPPGKKVRVITTRHIVKYLGGFAVVTLITILTITAIKDRKKVTPGNTANKSAAVASITSETIKPTKRRPATRKREMAPKPATPTSPVKAAIASTRTRPLARKPVIKTRNAASIPAVPSVTRIAPADHRPDTAAHTGKPSTSAIKAPISLNEFYSKLKKEAQAFTILPGRDTTLVGKEGTRLAIPANAFVSKTGTRTTGVVRIILTEFYQYDDIVAAKLSTTAGGRQLVTGGMLHLQADADGEAVALSPQKSIEVKMPTDNYDERMQLFTGSKGISNPKRVAFVENRMIDTVRLVPMHPVDSNAIDWKPAGQEQTIPGRENAYNIKVLNLAAAPYKVSNRNKTARFLLSKDITIPEKQLKEKLLSRYDGFYNKIKFKRVPHSRSRNVIDSAWIEYRWASFKKLVSPEERIRYMERVRNDSINYAVRLKSLKNYSFTITTLGWLNCDKWQNDPTPKIEFTINLGAGQEAANFVSQLVFTRYKSVMNGYYTDSKIQFRNIPENEPVQLVSIGVKEGKVVYCIQPLVVSRKEVTDLRFEETTPQQFRQKLAELKLISNEQ